LPEPEPVEPEPEEPLVPESVVPVPVVPVLPVPVFPEPDVLPDPEVPLVSLPLVPVVPEPVVPPEPDELVVPESVVPVDLVGEQAPATPPIRSAIAMFNNNFLIILYLDFAAIEIIMPLWSMNTGSDACV
jgi:hypothetical protein